MTKGDVFHTDYREFPFWWEAYEPGSTELSDVPRKAEVAQGLSPKNRSFGDTERILTFYRPSCDKRRMIFGGRVKWRDNSATEMAPYLYQLMVERYPQLAGHKITHAWSGNVALTLDEQPHAGELEGLHYSLGCNG